MLILPLVMVVEDREVTESHASISISRELGSVRCRGCPQRCVSGNLRHPQHQNLKLLLDVVLPSTSAKVTATTIATGQDEEEKGKVRADVDDAEDSKVYSEGTSVVKQMKRASRQGWKPLR